MTDVIIVDQKDNPIGIEEKLKAHLDGKLHRAFSIFIFNSKGELMLQKRAESKYHSGGLWSNTCCSHPRPNQDIQKEAENRLKEEMGFECSLQEVFSLPYEVKVISQQGDLIEHEFDHIFIGVFDGQAEINPQEAQDWKWIKINELKRDLKENPDKYTPWFHLLLDKTLQAKDSLEK